MENRRLFTFLMTSLLFLILWNTVIGPKFFPPAKKKAKPVEAKILDPPVADPQQALAAEATDPADPNAPAPAVATAVLTIPDHPSQTLTLGSVDPASGYALEVELNSAGAAIESVSLTSPQFRDLKNKAVQARIVSVDQSPGELNPHRTFSTAFGVIDKQLEKVGQTLETADWKLAGTIENEEGGSATFEYESPDKALLIRKTYTLPRLKLTGKELATAWRENASFYTLQVAIEMINQSDKSQTVEYEMQGPVGVLLENEEHTSKYRDIDIEFMDGTKGVTTAAGTVKKYVDQIKTEADNDLSPKQVLDSLREDREWTSVFRYVGVDVQFFAALIAPIDDRPEEAQTDSTTKWIERTFPVLIRENMEDARKSDISVRMASNSILLKPKGDGDSVKHKYAFFVGPKRRELLDPPPMAAGQVLNYGWFGPVARVMHFLLDTFYMAGMPYFLAIISLTVLVRGLMFPISRKQAISAARMKELQPKLAELKEKYADDREKFAKAQMELWRKHKINPIGGCLPLFLQMPIFIGLYTALNSAVDLRGQTLLWINNLAAPDALFRLPVPLPYLGSDFSILPLFTVGLFLTQQKMFMPPATDDQQAAQYKMMNMMTLFMGALFWHQASGLCIYFIASSVWSIAERKLLGTGKLSPPSGASVEVVEPDSSPKPGAKSKPASTPAKKDSDKAPGFLQKLLDAAQNARDQAEQQREKDTRKGKKR
ncbi:MAG TPA: membrane protein insertase YidC [Planctomycetaceae bacterium]|nr:membrane protein insertase YidC [Planctomycetaceae bacterium]HQZ67044.1 membrane protein insertase YidC [Planctomycetaceae bacterium]